MVDSIQGKIKLGMLACYLEAAPAGQFPLL